MMPLDSASFLALAKAHSAEVHFYNADFRLTRVDLIELNGFFRLMTCGLPEQRR